MSVPAKPSVGHKFVANCLECDWSFDDFVFGINIGGRVSALRFERNHQTQVHCQETGHKMFEIVNSQYHRVELLVPDQGSLALQPERGLNP